MFFKMKKNIPVIYQYQHSFVEVLKKMVNDDSLNIIVSLINFEDTKAQIIINKTVVGVIYAPEDNDNSAETPILSFTPYPDFFKFVQLDNVNDFLNLSNKFMLSYMNTIVMNEFAKSLVERKTLDNCNLFKLNHYSGTFMNKYIAFNESSIISFGFVKDGNDFKLIDDFHIKIKPRDSSVLLLALADMSPLQFVDLLGFSLEKKNSTYLIKHDHVTPIHSITFKDSDEIPNMTDFIANIIYYVSIKQKKIEMPSFEDFCKNPNDYKQIFEMSLI